MKNYLQTLIILFFATTFLQSQAVSEDFTTPGTHTYTIPTGYKATIMVQVWGGGGGSEGGGSGGKAGGGGGGFSIAFFNDLAAGEYSVVVGAAGVGLTQGGTSSVDINGLMQSTGGTGGTSTTPGTGGVGTGGVGTDGTGGSGGLPNNGHGGGGGSDGNPQQQGPPFYNGENATTSAGGAGKYTGGTGGTAPPPFRSTSGLDSRSILSVNGENGSSPGGGAGGNADGGTATPQGGDGAVSITVFSSVLPIKIASVNISNSNDKVKIAFTTVSEINSDYIGIERSGDAVSFEEIGRISAKRNSTVSNNYSMMDETPYAGVNYYRLRLVDLDGSIEYSKVYSIVNDHVKTAALFTFKEGLLSVDLSSHAVREHTLQVFDVSGRIIYESSLLGGDRHSIDLPSRIRGIHFVSLQTDDHRSTDKIMLRD